MKSNKKINLQHWEGDQQAEDEGWRTGKGKV